MGLQAIKDKFRGARTHIIAAALAFLAYLGVLALFNKRLILQPPMMGQMVEPHSSFVAPLVEKSEQFIRDKAVFKVVPVFHSALPKRAKDEVIVRVEISPPGEVISAALIEGDSMLRTVAEEAARRWKFEPMLVDGKPARVESRLTFQIRQ
ncbi:MAG TPA: TonB family protein [Blastocatellia bacterium]|nr:TonB family protein [Blastocatellia bacterium]